jgi:hypothetical protein
MDILNENNLDGNFSNASGCGLPPVCSITKRVWDKHMNCKNIAGRTICVGGFRTVRNQACVDSKDRHTACMNDPNRKKLMQRIKEGVNKASTEVKGGIRQTQKNIKKEVVHLREKVGDVGRKFRNKFRSIMRKGILFNIKNNIHGTATKLYPAVASDSAVAQKKYKRSFVTNSRGSYGQVVKQWESLGGNENDLRNAIVSGHSKSFLKVPYKSFNGDDSYALYAFFTPSNYTYLSKPQPTIYFGVGGDSTNPDDSKNAELSQDGVVNDATGVEEVPSQQEEVKGIRAFFAWLLSLFSRNKMSDNPYAEGTPEYTAYEQQKNGDAGNQPDPSEANDPAIQDVYAKGQADGAGTNADDSAGDENLDNTGSDTILGMPKGVAIALGIAVLAIGGFFVYKKFIKK